MAVLIGIACNSWAQDPTYNHDEYKMQQFLVAETGVGGLSPTYYYQLYHNSYRHTANETGKGIYRLLTQQANYKNIAYADSIKQHLKRREVAEAYNLADCTIDLAWNLEKDKIKSAQLLLKAKIGMIPLSGGTLAAQRHWEEYYTLTEKIISETRSAYQPNAKRSEQFLKIYLDIKAKTEIVNQYNHTVQAASKGRGVQGHSRPKKDRAGHSVL